MVENNFTDILVEEYKNLSESAIGSAQVTIGQYKEVLEYLDLDSGDKQFLDNNLRDRIKAIYTGDIFYEDLLSYYKKYANDLKHPELFSDDWCFLVAFLLVEKNMYQRKYAVSPIRRVADMINAYLYEHALAKLPNLKFSEGSDDHNTYAKRDYNATPDFLYKDKYTAEAKKCSVKYKLENVKYVAERLVTDFRNIKSANYGIIVYEDKVAVIFDTNTLDVVETLTDLKYEQLYIENDTKCQIKYRIIIYANI